MSYLKRYETSIFDYAGNRYEVEIEKQNYSGSSTHIFEGSELTISYDGGERDNTSKPIKNSLCTFSFWVRENQNLTEYNELLESYYKQFRLSIYKNRATLQNLLAGSNEGFGVSWVLTGSSPTVTLSSQDSKELMLELEGGLINIPYVLNYNFDVTMISGFASSSTPLSFTQINTGTSFSRNTPYNNRWQALLPSVGSSTVELKGLISNAIPLADYTIYFPTAIANIMSPYTPVGTTVYRLYATDDSVIDTVTKPYNSQGQKPETITFNGNVKTPAYFTIQFTLNNSNTGTGEFWVYDSSQSINPFTNVSIGSISGETGSTSGYTVIRLLDQNQNVIQTETVNWNHAGNYNGNIVVQSSTEGHLPTYISIESVHLSGDTSIITLNQISLAGAINDNLYWRGWVKPEFLTCSYISPSFLLNLEATDGLTDLKDINFPESATTDNFIQALEVIKYGLDATDNPLPLRSQVNLHPVEFSGSTLSNIHVTGSRFKKVENGRSTYWSLEDSLSRLLKTFRSHIKQENGYWVITQQNENNSLIYDYDYDTLAELNRQLRDRTITVDSDSTTNVNQSPYAILNSDELSKIEPLRYINADLFNESSGDNNIFNPNFNEGLDGWTNSTGATAFDQFLLEDDGDEHGQHVKLINGQFFSGGANRNCYFDSFTFNLALATGDTVVLSFDADCRSLTYSGGSASNPDYLVQILDSTTLLPVVSNAAQGYIYTGWRTYETRWQNISYTGTCILRVWTLVPAYAGVTLADVRFDNFSTTVVYANEQGFNRWHTATNVNTTAIKQGNIDFYFADSFVSTTKASLKYSFTGSTSESWSNADQSVTGKSIIDLYLKEEHLQSALFKDFLRVQIRSLQDVIEIDSILDITSKDKRYYVLSVTKDILNNVFDLTLMQRLEDQEPNLVFTRGQYTTSGGEGGSSSGGGSGGSGGSEQVIYYPGENITIVDNVINAIIPATQAISFKTQSFTSSGNSTYSVTNGTVATLLMIDVNGLAQIKNVDYSITGNNVDFATAIPAGSVVTAHYFEVYPFGYSVESFTSTGVETSFNVASPIQQVAFIDVNGAIQLSSNYSVSGLYTINLGTTLPAGSTIQVHYFTA